MFTSGADPQYAACTAIPRAWILSALACTALLCARWEAISLFTATQLRHTIVVKRFNDVQPQNLSSTASGVKFAVCVASQTRTFVRKDIREHFNAAVIQPLRIGGTVRIFLHLGPSTSAEYEVDLISEYSPTSLRLYDVQLTGRTREPGCLSAGYPQSFRQRECLSDVQKHERVGNIVFDHIVLTRTDIEYFAKLPPGVEWRSLRRDLVLTGLMIVRDEQKNPYFTAEADEVIMMTDALTVIPRVALETFADIASSYERCISWDPPVNNTCKFSDTWWVASECRVQTASMNFKVGELSIDSGSMYRGTIFRCSNPACSSVWRDYCHVEPCNLEQRSPASSLADNQIRFPAVFYNFSNR